MSLKQYLLPIRSQNLNLLKGKGKTGKMTLTTNFI